MKKIIQVHMYKGEEHYIAECTDLPVVTQGKTLDELVANLKEALELHLEGEDLADYDISAHPSVLANLELDLPVHAKADYSQSYRPRQRDAQSYLPADIAIRHRERIENVLL